MEQKNNITIERHADPLDMATNIADTLVNLTLSNRVQYIGESAEYCEECDQPIPKARQLAVPGVQFCVHCTEKLERIQAGRQFGSNRRSVTGPKRYP